MDQLKRFLIFTVVVVVALTTAYLYATGFLQNLQTQAKTAVASVQWPTNVSTSSFIVPDGYEVNNYGANVNLLVEKDRQRNATDLKTILMWNNAYSGKTYGFGHGREPFYEFQCPETRCVTTGNRSYLPDVSDFDAILIHHPELNSGDLPFPRDPRQRFVFWSKETAQWYAARRSEEGLFNWTMTFKLDSDIPAPYGRFVQVRQHPTGRELDELIEQFGKENVHLAGDRGELSLSWVVSNCRSLSKRDNLVRKIKHFVDVTIYGGCGTKQCVKGSYYECMKQLEETHKFYLSFENSLCNDYVTEKFFKVFDVNMIPIVFGGTDYAKIAPHRSFINVLDFKTVKDLADYLKVLHEDDAKFAEYFWWRDFYVRRNHKADDAQSFCELCRKLHDPSETVKVYDDLKTWWQTDSNCRKLDVAAIEDGEIRLK